VNTTSLNKTQIVRAKEEHLSAISELAGVIWRACYPGIITNEQIDYMLARMYSLDVLRDEIRSKASAMTCCWWMANLPALRPTVQHPNRA